MRKTNQKGFTIIELLVVIVIIGILVALALPQLFAAQQRGRDTERKNDLKNIKTQLENFYNDNDEYPAGLDEIDELTDEDVQDPKTKNDYTYTAADANSEGGFQSYTLRATLENKKDKSATDTNGTYEVESVNKPEATTPETP